jgi:hypothetical protein
MGVRLIVEPRKTVSWEQLRKFPPYTIAVDGYCRGSPRSTPDGLILNINHHEDCDRIATRSSCAQALHLVKMGLFQTFTYQGHRRADVYVNDCDEDVTWTTYILRNPAHIDRPRLKAMVQLEDLLDMSAGLYPIKKRWHLLKKLVWVSEPYYEAKSDKSLHRLGADAMTDMLETMHRRIRDTLFGRGKELEPDTRFEEVEEFDGWSYIREIGRHARYGIAHKGISAFVSHVAKCGSRDRYVIVRRSRFISGFPLERICDMLNEEEGIAASSIDRWGGSDNIIGSPREKASSLAPKRVIEIVKAACAERRMLLSGAQPRH